MSEEGSLARTHLGSPGLPRGRNRLPEGVAAAAQRDRLLRAVIAAVSDLGYQRATLGEIVKRARVSRAVFYEHFASKEECFFAAVRSGGQMMYRRVADAAGDADRVAEAGTPVHAALRAFLRFLHEERGFARAFYIGMPSAGTSGLTELDAALGSYVELIAGWHRDGLAAGEPWPPVDEAGYRALVDAVVGTASRAVREERFDTIAELEGPLGAVLMAVLAGSSSPQSTRLSPPSTTST